MVCDIRPLLWDICGKLWLFGTCGLKEGGKLREGSFPEGCSPAAPSYTWAPWDKMVTRVLQEGWGLSKTLKQTLAAAL